MLCNPSGRRLTQKSSAQIQPRDLHITVDPSLPGLIESMGHLAKCHRRNDVPVVSTWSWWYTCLWVGKHDRYRVHGTMSSACWCYQCRAQFVTSVCACVRYQIGANWQTIAVTVFHTLPWNGHVVANDRVWHWAGCQIRGQRAVINRFKCYTPERGGMVTSAVLFCLRVNRPSILNENFWHMYSMY